MTAVVAPPRSTPPDALGQGRGGTAGPLECKGPWPALAKAGVQRPMVCVSRSKASAVAAAVSPWAKSRVAYHHSRSRGAGARVIRGLKSFVPIRHCSRDQSISLRPSATPRNSRYQLPRLLYKSTPHVCAFHLGFGLVGIDGEQGLHRGRDMEGPSGDQHRGGRRFHRECPILGSRIHAVPGYSLADVE